MATINQTPVTDQQRSEFLRVWHREGGLSGAALKLIACFFMFFDHLAQSGIFPGLEVNYFVMDHPFAFISNPDLGTMLVLLGRLVFPIYCFFIVQGMMLTGNRKRYIQRLFAFALISEIFFDYGLFGGLNWGHQNVFFTLALGATMMAILDRIEQGSKSRIIQIILSLLTFVVIGFASILIQGDYSLSGIIAMLLLWLCRWSRRATLLGMIPAFFFEIKLFGSVYLAIPLIYMYNGVRGNINKYFFYLFYPAHLLLLWIIRLLV